MIIYPMLRKSIFDSKIPENYVKIKIRKHEKERNTYSSFNGLELRYCSLGICPSERKFCNDIFDTCPYEVYRKMEQPRKGTKAYEDYIIELNLQLAVAVLKKVFNEQIEKALYNELDEDEYKKLIKDLSNRSEDELSSSSLYKCCSNIDCITLIKDINRERSLKKNQVKKENKIGDVVYNIGNFLYIDINHLPVIKNADGKNLWYRDHWVSKDNFTPEFLIALEKHTSLQSWLRKEYNENIQKLKEQLEEKYGLMTLLILQGYK